MKKLFVFFLLIIFLTGCPMEHLHRYTEDLDFEYSVDDIKTNEPVELTIKYSPGELEEDEVYIIQLMNDVEMELLEGTLLECDVENIMFVDFVRPENRINTESEENEVLLPYCKLSLIFKNAGTYDFRMRRTYKSDPIFHFSTCIHKTITVTED
ncbi:MAG: hypothetical protein J5527_05520 [Treponema sp.]|nr:hypothetical protein [Treponema sp.]